MARTRLPKRKTYAVFIRSLRGGVNYMKREQFNIVTLDWSDGQGVKSYIEPICGRPFSNDVETEELYDDIKIFDKPPYSGISIGV